MSARRASLLAGVLVALALVGPVDAHVLEVTASATAPGADAPDDTIRDAVRAAVAQAVRDVDSFTPTLIVLTRAVIVGDRIYLRLLLADQDGERTLRGLAVPADAERPADAAPGQLLL